MPKLRLARNESPDLVLLGVCQPRLAIPEGGTPLEEIERCLVETARQQASRNQTQAVLDISRDALGYKLKKSPLP